MLCGTVSFLIVKLRIPIIGWIEITEESRSLHAIELHQVTPYMLCNQHILNPPLPEGFHQTVHLFFVLGKKHILAALRRSITPFQPIALCLSLCIKQRSCRDMIVTHQSVQHQSCRAFHTFSAIHGDASRCRFLLENRQRLWQSSHRQIHIGLILLTEVFLLHEPHAIALLQQSFTHSIQYQLVLLNGVRRELGCTIYQQDLPHVVRI